MKAFRKICLNFTMFIILGVVNVCAQTVAIGHVSAEIVESISAASQAITNFDLKNVDIPNSALKTENSNWNYENVNLGKFKINSGSAITCNVMIKTAELSNTNGNEFTIEPSVTTSLQSDAQRNNGDQTLHLKGKARLMQEQASGLYQGSYTMIFAYN